jgi:hypothetical protein
MRRKKMSFLNRLVDKITTGPQAQYILGGALAAIILLSLGSVFIMMKGKTPTEPVEQHGFCLETEKEFVIDPKNMPPGEMMPLDDMMDVLIYSPYTQRRTAVRMTHCPNCQKWFVPECLQDALERSESQSPMPMPLEDTQTQRICPYCNTDIIQWYRDHRKRR